MNLFIIARNNLKRRKVKMLFSVLGLCVGVATIIALASIITAMHLDLGNRIDEFGANAVIMPRSEDMEMNYGENALSDVTFDVQKLTMEDIPRIYDSSIAEYLNIVSPKLIGAVLAEEQKVLLVGIETKKEFTQKPWFSLYRQQGVEAGQANGDLALMDIPQNGLILGYNAARAFDKQVGDTLNLDQEPFFVYGILNQMGGEEDGLVYANLGIVQKLFNQPGALSMIEISAYCNNCPIEEIAVALDEALPNSRTIPLRQAALFREESITRFSAFGYALSGMVLLLSALVVLTTILSSVNERTREIGILRAIGFRQSHILKIIFMEAAMISIVGGISGFLVGSLVAQYGGPFLAQIQGEIPLRLELFFPALLLSALLAVLSSAYPALKAARMDPAEALRFI